MGTVYLIHFDEKFKHAQHYIGFTVLDAAERFKRHFNGNGARLLRAVKKANITFKIVRVWENVPQSFERQLKNRHHASDFCPVCKGEQNGTNNSGTN